VPHEKAVVLQKAFETHERAFLQKAFVTHEKGLVPQRAHHITPDRKQHRTCYLYRNHRRAATYVQVRRPLHPKPTKFLGHPLFPVKSRVMV
jgi:hypothetical protein